MIKKLAPFILTLLLYSQAEAALTIDGSATATEPAACSPANTVAITTTKTNNIIILNIALTGTSPTVSGVTDVQGLTWNKRAASDNTTVTFEEWWAYSPAILTVDTVTIGCGGTVTGGRNNIYGVNGANTNNPFDVNASLPAVFASLSATSISATINTSNPNTMLIAGIRGLTSLGTITEPTGFSSIISSGSAQDSSQKTVSTTQSSLGLTYSWSGGLNAVAGVFDAIVAAPTANVLMGNP